MGCMGMGMNDFCRCTPSEFRAVWDAWNDRRMAVERDQWERLRMSCLCSLQPWTKQRLSPHDIMEFPWEEKQEKQKQDIPDRQEIMRRYREEKRKAGLK